MLLLAIFTWAAVSGPAPAPVTTSPTVWAACSDGTTCATGATSLNGKLVIQSCEQRLADEHLGCITWNGHSAAVLLPASQQPIGPDPGADL